MALMGVPEQALMDTVVNGLREAEKRSYTMVQNVKIEVAALRQMSVHAQAPLLHKRL